MSLDFKQVESTLAGFANIHPERRNAFVARLKQWQKSGFPEGINSGRGRKAQYGATQLYQLALCLLLIELGLTPERAHTVVRLAWDTFRDSIVEATICLANREKHWHYCFINLDFLTDLKESEPSHEHLWVKPLTSDWLEDALTDYGPEDVKEWSAEEVAVRRSFELAVRSTMARTIIVEIDSMLLRLWAYANNLGVGADSLRSEVAGWERELRARLSRERDEEAQDAEGPSEIIDHVAPLLAKFDASRFAYDTLSQEWTTEETPHGGHS